MPEHMKTHHTDRVADFIWHGTRYIVPVQFIKKYKVKMNDTSSINEVFDDLIKKNGEPGTLLKGLRAKESLTQVQFSKKIGITQANLSAMENGRRMIGKEIAKRISKKFGVDYRIFL